MLTSHKYSFSLCIRLRKAKNIIKCPLPRKSLVKGEGFIRFERRPELAGSNPALSSYKQLFPAPLKNRVDDYIHFSIQRLLFLRTMKSQIIFVPPFWIRLREAGANYSNMLNTSLSVPHYLEPSGFALGFQIVWKPLKRCLTYI